ncbi:hypothetical protein FAI41_03110 [Acetobacteraceae bacterium]|nr:hypothetical protein FAI41_03110 [Acetobacteraceae bacterium]
MKNPSLPTFSLKYGTWIMIGVAGFFASCAPLDQRVWNQMAGIEPKYVPPPPPPAPPPPAPFVEILSGTPESDYGPQLEEITKIALARKPNMLFIIRLRVPTGNGPEEQVKRLLQLVPRFLMPVSEHMIKAGAQPIQLDMGTESVPYQKSPSLRIQVR